MSDQYSLTIYNTSGIPANIAMYQTFPKMTTGLPLVWYTISIPQGNHDSFLWSIDWELDWGTSPQMLVPGVMYTSGGTPVPVSPNTPGGINEISLTYLPGQAGEPGSFDIESSYNDSSLASGTVAAKTDVSFTDLQGQFMNIAISMNGKPALAVTGMPNATYVFDTHPTYWICVTGETPGIAVSESATAGVTQITFDPGVTSLVYTLNGENQFILGAPVTASN